MSEFINAILEQLETTLGTQTLGTRAGELLTDVIAGLIVFGLYLLLWLIVRTLLKPLMRRSPLDETWNVFIVSVVKYGLLLAGLVSALAAAGVNTAALLASLVEVGIQHRNTRRWSIPHLQPAPADDARLRSAPTAATSSRGPRGSRGADRDRWCGARRWRCSGE